MLTAPVCDAAVAAAQPATNTVTTSAAAPGPAPPRYSPVPVPASADGIGKRYMGREIAGVMGWQGAASLKRQQREREERTDLLVLALQLRPGMVVADIGAGTGYVAQRMAPAVMPGGRVLAVDVPPQMVRTLQDTVRQSGLTQIEPLLVPTTTSSCRRHRWIWR